MLKKNQIIELDIEDMTFEGSGVGRADDGCVIFVPGTAAGDRILAKIVKVKKNYAYAIVDTLITASNDRTDTACDVYKACGGCCFKHVSYEAELRIKENTVRENLRKAGVKDVDFDSIVPSPKENCYRNKAQFPIRRDESGRVIIGFYARRSHRVVDTSSCALHPGFFTEIAEYTRGFIEKYRIPVYDETMHTGLMRHLYIRYGEKTGEVMICLVINGKKLPHAQEYVAGLLNIDQNIKSVMLNINTKKTNVILGAENLCLYGSSFITDILCGNLYKISPLSFYQVNRTAAEKLYNLAFDMAGLSGNETSLDMYCGVGTIGLSMAKRVKKVIGAEIVPQAIEDAKENALANGISNAEFICADAAEAARTLQERKIKPDVVFLDPPRKGCSAELIDILAEMSPQKIIMISCNSATMARDVVLLEERGYSIKKVCPLDMFPRTAHVECVACLTKK